MHVRDERLQLPKGGQAVDAGVLEVDRSKFRRAFGRSTRSRISRQIRAATRRRRGSRHERHVRISIRQLRMWSRYRGVLWRTRPRVPAGRRAAASEERLSLVDVVDGSQKMTYLLTE